MAKKGNEPPKFADIGRRLASFIEDSGEPNARQFALKAGLAPQLVSNLAAGYSMPSGETLVALASAFRGFDALWLLTGKYTNGKQPEANTPAPTSDTEPQGPHGGGAQMRILRPTYEELVVENTGLHKRVDEQAATIADLRTDKGNLWHQNKQLLDRKPKASADAADPTPEAAARMWVSHSVGKRKPGRYVYQEPEQLPRVAAGFRLSVA